jgi:hypothetical protein
MEETKSGGCHSEEDVILSGAKNLSLWIGEQCVIRSRLVQCAIPNALENWGQRCEILRFAQNDSQAQVVILRRRFCAEESPFTIQRFFADGFAESIPARRRPAGP